MEDSSTHNNDEYLKEIQTMQEKTLVSPAANESFIQSGKLELKQTNIVTFDKEVESVVIDKRHIQTIRNLCKAEDTDNTVATEICLAISMLFAGAFLSAIISKVDFVFNCMAILFYIISPVTAVGCFVAYYFKRNIDIASKKQLAEHILEYLPREEGKK